MHTKPIALIAAVLIVTTLGLSFIGVAAAGNNGRGPKPTHTPAPPTAAAGTPSSIQLTPDPLRIACDGAEASTLTVRVTDAGGPPVPNGTLATFSADYGVADPPQAATRGGEAETRIILSPQAAQSFAGAFATVRVGEIEASIRIRCDAPAGCAQFPTSPPCQPPPCPASPPTSPPCEGDPPPCPSHPMSPPCIQTCLDFESPSFCLTPTPCVDSPPCGGPDPCSDPNAHFSPPCGTPTPTPNAPARFAIDCDLVAPGLQSNCDYPLDADEIEVGVVLVNDSPQELSLAAFQFDLINSRKDLLFPPAVPGSYFDSNPNFNDALQVPGGSPWNCALLPPINDLGTGEAGTTVSRLVCFIFGEPTTPAILPANGTLLLGTVSYVLGDNPSNSGTSISLAITNVATAEPFGTEFTETCYPPDICATANIELFDPLLTPIAVATSTPTPAPNITPTVTAAAQRRR